MIFNSIRWRLQAWHGLILVLVLTGFGLTAYHVARDNQMRRIDQDLEQHMLSLVRPMPPWRPPGSQPGPAGPGNPAPQWQHKHEAVEQPRFSMSIEDAIANASV